MTPPAISAALPAAARYDTYLSVMAAQAAIHDKLQQTAMWLIEIPDCNTSGAPPMSWMAAFAAMTKMSIT
jgi:hypothetical protein